jgi:hypothetical protein
MYRIKLFLITCLAYLLFTSSAWVNLTLVRPSELPLPVNIQSIALIDRTKQEETPQNKVEQILTGEAFKQDEQAVMKLTDGFIEACSGTRRFVTVRTSERYPADGTKSTFPAPLDWNTVTDICNKHQTDALLSVEIFDTDFILTNNPVRVETSGDPGRPGLRVEFRATAVAVINMGIRLYDAANRVILDEYQITRRMNFDAQGSTMQAALNLLLDKVEATNRASYDAGFSYGQRITPTYYQVTRYFFDKPKKNLGAGVRYSSVADWQGAIDAWRPVVDGGKRKHAGRAAFNIAVAYEVLGDMDKAKEWAARSHTEFAEKEADEYYKMLNNRIREERLVSEQITE